MRITVIGTHVASHEPEVGRLRLEVSRSGAEAAQVYDETVATVQAITADLRGLDGQSDLESWEVDPVATSSWTPHDPSGRPQAEEHTARAEVVAVFRDPEVLAGFAARHGSTPGLSQHPVVWELIDETRGRLRDEATAGAVVAAHERARVLAQAAGAGRVRCLAIADPGLLDRPGGEAVAMSLKAGFAPRADHDPVEPRPGRLEVRAEVHATFEADVDV